MRDMEKVVEALRAAYTISTRDDITNAAHMASEALTIAQRLQAAMPMAVDALQTVARGEMSFELMKKAQTALRAISGDESHERLKRLAAAEPFVIQHSYVKAIRAYRCAVEPMSSLKEAKEAVDGLLVRHGKEQS